MLSVIILYAMAHLILFEDETRDNLLPLTFTRPVAELRIGILTIKEKWERWLGWPVSYITEDYLAEKYPIDYGKENYLVNASALPSSQLCRLIRQMDFNEALLQGDQLIAAKLDERQLERLVQDKDIEHLQSTDLDDTEYLKINGPWDLFRLNDQALRDDFELVTRGRTSQPLSDTNRVIGNGPVFLEEGASVECAILNTQNGPIYIGKNAEIMEGCMIRGGFSLGEGAVVKMGAKIYGATTIGPYCKVGGEVNNSVLLANSNKSHDGYLGNSVLGEWCNLGADTNNSNLKNTYEEVKLWNYPAQRFVPTGLQFCGLIMGDHSKCGINTMFNTGTVVGVCANIFGDGFPRNYIPSFSWGGVHGFQTYRTEKAFDMIERVMERRQLPFTIQDRLIMLRIFEDTAQYRNWEKHA